MEFRDETANGALDIHYLMQEVPEYKSTEHFTSTTLRSVFANNRASFTNVFSPTSRIISAHANYDDRTADGETGKSDRWSDLIFALWDEVCYAYDTSPSQLRWVVPTCYHK